MSELFLCLDCNIPVELTVNGKCSRCGSGAVTQASAQISLSATLSKALEHVMIRVHMTINDKSAGSMTLTRAGWEALKEMMMKVGGHVSESEYSPQPVDREGLLKRFRSSQERPIGSRTISQLLREKDAGIGEPRLSPLYEAIEKEKRKGKRG